MKKITLIIAAISAIGLSGCKKYLDQTANPNAPSETTVPLALTGAEKIMADIPNGIAPNEGGSYTNYGYWMGSVAVSSGFIVQPNLSQYVLTTNDFQPWTDLYLNLSNIVNMTAQANAQGLPNYAAIGMIMNAYDFQQVVDNYNDAPYSQAFNSKNLFPAYDKGPAIYAALIAECDAAIALINKSTTSTTPAGDDIIFGGNMTNWKKFANTLKLRLILRQSNLSNFSTIAGDMASTVNEGFLDGSTQALAQPGYTLNDAHGGQASPFWHAYGLTQNGVPENILVKANTYGIQMIHGFNDPRLSAIYSTVTNPNGGTTTIRGLFLGDPTLSQDTNSAGTLSGLGPGLLVSAAQPAIVFSGAESLFLQAEAANDGIIPGSAQTLYESAITAAFEQVGLTDAQAATYSAQPIANVGWAASPNKQQAIITQKYISLIGTGFLEQYNEWRRTDYPAGVPVTLDPGAAGPIPRRVLYPQTEYDTNGANVKAEGTISPFTSRIFWDTRP